MVSDCWSTVDRCNEYNGVQHWMSHCSSGLRNKSNWSRIHRSVWPAYRTLGTERGTRGAHYVRPTWSLMGWPSDFADENTTLAVRRTPTLKNIACLSNKQSVDHVGRALDGHHRSAVPSSTLRRTALGPWHGTSVWESNAGYRRRGNLTSISRRLPVASSLIVIIFFGCWVLR